MSFIRKSVVKGHTYYQECESYRENGKVKTRVLKHLGKNPNGQTPPNNYEPYTNELGQLRQQIEAIEAENRRLISQNDRLNKQLKRFSLSALPLTYEGALSYIEAIATDDIYPQPEQISKDLNRLGFPAFKDGQWSKDKVKRQLEKFRVGKVKTIDI